MQRRVIPQAQLRTALRLPVQLPLQAPMHCLCASLFKCERCNDKNTGDGNKTLLSIKVMAAAPNIAPNM